LYTNVIKCDFDIRHHQQVEDSGFLTWTMQLQHPKLNGGEAVNVNGVSHIRFSGDRVIYHRDYFDLGEMLYENIPLLGFVIKNIKQRLGK
jgi:limonene-1,2-epoxide hydrolase